MTAGRTIVLGLSAGLHDSAAALVVDGDIVAAVEEERLSRRKHDASFPARAASTCLAIAGIAPGSIDVVAHHEKPLGVIDRHLRARTRYGPFALAGLVNETPRLVGEQLSVGRAIERWFRARDVVPAPIVYVEHHTSHGAAAFYPSPFERAAVLTVDGVGEWATVSLGRGVHHRLELECEVRFPDSIGMLYTAFTEYCGFRPNSGEGELMGLAPFGRPVHADTIREHLVDAADDGSFRIDQRYFAYAKGRKMTSRRFHALFGGPPRPRGAPPTQRECDLAASVQVVTEELVLGLAAEARRRTGLGNLCLAGGVALNCVANGRVAREAGFDGVWVQPAAGDAGSAVGAALWVHHEHLGNPRAAPADDAMHGAFLGPSFRPGEIHDWLRANDIPHTTVDGVEDLRERVATRLADGEVVGWFQGRMEFGPRALGHRSILADPRSPTVQSRLNGLVKERAGFRPFAPAVLADRAPEWFDHQGDAPYMTFVTSVAEKRWVEVEGSPATDLAEEVAIARSTIPAVTHVDRSARIQTVDAARNPELAGLLAAFDALTGCPVLLNTSFNARDEPIVCTPADAYRTFRRTGLDLLVLGPHLVEAS